MKKIEIYDVRLGDRVRWDYAAGIIRGEVIKIEMAPTAAGDYVPWYTIQSLNGNISCLCGRASYLNMMQFSIRFRDYMRAA